MTNLAGLLERLQRLHRLLVRRLVIRPVNQHQIHVIAAQAAQACFRMLRDTIGRSISTGNGGVALSIRIVVIGKTHLGYQHNIFSTLS